MLLFRGDEHIDRWCAARGVPRGGTMTIDQAWHLAYEWYRNKIKSDWRRHTLDEAEALFAATGLDGEFWRLREIRSA